MEENEKKENIGTCRYCGQTRHIETIGDVSQSDLDDMATDMCLCLDAVNAKRKKARDKKLKEFIEKRFKTQELIDFIKEAIKLIDDETIEDFSITLYPDKTCKIWKSNDGQMNIRIKKTENDEIKT